MLSDADDLELGLPSPDEAVEILGMFIGRPGSARSAWPRTAASGCAASEIATPEGTKHYFVHVERGTCEAGCGARPDPDLTIAIRLADMLALATGALSGDDAFKAGKLGLSGNPFIGMKLPERFDAVS